MRLRNDATAASLTDRQRDRGKPFALRWLASTPCCLVVGVTLCSARVDASPNVDLDDPRNEELLRHVTLGEIADEPPIALPLTELQLDRLLGHESRLDSWWFRPIDRAALTTRVTPDVLRPYSTPIRPRDVSGSIGVTCEHREGRPCGDGASAQAEIDTSGGYGAWLSGTIRARGIVGNGANTVALDRAYVSAELPAVLVEVGRDVLVLGPASRTQLSWGDNAAPLDQVRIATASPLRLGPARIGGLYVVGRARSPQRFPGTIVSVARVQVALEQRVTFGLVQLLQLGGDGAPQLGLVDFILEHVRRRDASAGPSDTSNRRFGGDVVLRVPELEHARLYYAIMFEDIRRAYWYDAVRYDADHLFGLELAALGANHRHGLTVEWYQTGMRSQEHSVRTTGFTNAGFIVGAPLGPDARSFFVGGRVALPSFTLYPWLELARLSSDTYELIPYGPINRTSIGEDEGRYRFGARVRVPLRTNIWIDGEAMFEHVDDYAFQPGVTRNNGGLSASIIWYPDAPLGTLKLN